MYLLETWKKVYASGVTSNFGPPAGSKKWAPNLHCHSMAWKWAPFGPLSAWVLPQLRARIYATGQHYRPTRKLTLTDSCLSKSACATRDRCRSEVPARKVTVCPPCRRQASSAASASRICFRHHASTVALARDARSHQVQTVHARVQVPPRTRTSVPVGPLHACHGAHSPQIICSDTWKISVSPPDENQDDRSARILFRIVCCLECTSSAPARPWSLAEQFQN